MSQENLPDDGDLLVTILWALPRWWSVRGWRTLYVFRRALVVVGSSWGEIAEGSLDRKRSLQTILRDKRDAAATEGATVANLVEQYPDNQRVPWRSVSEAHLRRGWIESRLILRLEDGTELKWYWTRGDGLGGLLTPNCRFADVKSALREALGPALAP